jgi:hypothetical protein
VSPVTTLAPPPRAGFRDVATSPDRSSPTRAALLDQISFAAPDGGGDTGAVDAAYVESRIGGLAENAV